MMKTKLVKIYDICIYNDCNINKNQSIMYDLCAMPTCTGHSALEGSRMNRFVKRTRVYLASINNVKCFFIYYKEEGGELLTIDFYYLKFLNHSNFLAKK